MRFHKILYEFHDLSLALSASPVPVDNRIVKSVKNSATSSLPSRKHLLLHNNVSFLLKKQGGSSRHDFAMRRNPSLNGENVRLLLQMSSFPRLSEPKLSETGISLYL